MNKIVTVLTKIRLSNMMPIMTKSRFVNFLFILLAIFGLVDFTLAASRKFYIDAKYDAYQRNTADFVLVHTGQKAYFYVDEKYLLEQVNGDKKNYFNAVKELSDEMDNVIYPRLTSFYGDIVNPGLDKDPKFYVLLHPLKESAAGYFREKDSYDKLQTPGSNEHETIYLNAEFVFSKSANSYLAHEFTHLITFNQKNILQGLPEEVWLTEMISEYSPSYLGYLDNFGVNSYLERRSSYFFENPYFSLVTWKSQTGSYSAGAMFAQYLGERYDGNVFRKILKQKETGLVGFEKALKSIDKNLSMSELFVRWTITNYLNSCAIDRNYCYRTPWLKDYTVYPFLNVLTGRSNSSITVNDTITNWSAKWYKVVGGVGDLNIELAGRLGYKMSVPYILETKDGKIQVGRIYLDVKNQGQLLVKNFSSQYKYLVLIPSYHDLRKVGDIDITWSAYSSSVSNKASVKLIKTILPAQPSQNSNDFLTRLMQYLRTK